MKSSTPAVSASARVSTIASAVNATTGRWSPCARNTFTSSSPLPSLSCRSVSTRPIASSPASRTNASSSDAASTTRAPPRPRKCATMRRLSSVSSTSNTVCPSRRAVSASSGRNTPLRVTIRAGVLVRPRSGSTGSVNVNVLPTPTSERTAMSPPSIRASRRAMSRPSPTPPRPWLRWPCSNGRNKRSRSSAAMPMPVSITSSTSSARSPSDTTRACNATCPRGVYLMALPTRLMRICRRRSGSVLIFAGSSVSLTTVSSSPRSAARGSIKTPTSSSTVVGSVGTTCRSRRPASIFDRSSTSSSNANKCSAERCRRFDHSRVSGWLRSVAAIKLA